MEQDGEVSELIANRRFQFRFMRHEGWENALFVHWPVDAMVLKAKLPNGLEPDILDGFAWIGLVLLTERGVSVTPAAGRKIAPKIDHFGANITKEFKTLSKVPFDKDDCGHFVEMCPLPQQHIQTRNNECSNINREK